MTENDYTPADAAELQDNLNGPRNAHTDRRKRELLAKAGVTTPPT